MDTQLVAELRQMFIDGATPSKLMSHLADRLGGSDHLHFEIREYFNEAFRLPLLRNVTAKDDISPNERHAHFNRDVVPELVQRIAEWNTQSLERSWLNGLSVHSLTEHKERLKESRFDDLSRIWEELTEKEKDYILQKIAIVNRDWEVMKCLALLAERLQQQIVELNDQLKKQRSGQTDSQE